MNKHAFAKDDKTMPEKDPNTYNDMIEALRGIMPYFTTLALSCWGGVVHHVQRLRSGARKFSWPELFFDLIISSFAGILTHFLCEVAGIGGAKQALLVAVSGHMGTRAISSFEAMRDRMFNVQGEKR